MKRIKPLFPLLLSLGLYATPVLAQTPSFDHVVEAGQTVYSIARLYHVTPEDIYQLNPESRTSLRCGSTLKIPQNKSGQQFSRFHTIARGETLYKITQMYHISAEELSLANPGLSADNFRIGDVLVIPPSSGAAPSSPSSSAVRSDAGKMTHITMGLLLPLTQQNSEGQKMIEFYRGMLLAIEDLKNQGISVTLYTYDSGKSVTELRNALALPGLRNADLIVGPLSTAQIPQLSSFCKEHGIRLVIPFSSQCDEVNGNPYVYVANVPKEILFEESYRLIKDRFSDRSFVFWNNGEQRADDQLFIRGLKKELGTWSKPYKEITAGSGTDLLMSRMAPGRKNLIIPTSSSLPALQKLASELHALRKSYPGVEFSVLGHPEWQIYVNSQLENFFAFDTYIYSSFYKNMNKRACGPFEERFRKAFGTPLQNTYPGFGLLGYDLTRFFLLGMSSQGSRFNDRIESLSTGPLQHDFQFRRTTSRSGFINRKAELIHYTPDKKIDVIEFTRP